MLICGVFLSPLHACFAAFCTYIIGIIRGFIHILAGYFDLASIDLSQGQMIWSSSSLPNDRNHGGDDDEEWEGIIVRKTEEEAIHGDVSDDNQTDRTTKFGNHVQRKRSLTREEVKDMADAFLSRVKSRFRSSEAKMIMGCVSEREINQNNNSINSNQNNNTINGIINQNNNNVNDDEFHNHLAYLERLHRSYGPYNN